MSARKNDNGILQGSQAFRAFSESFDCGWLLANAAPSRIVYSTRLTENGEILPARVFRPEEAAIGSDPF